MLISTAYETIRQMIPRQEQIVKKSYHLLSNIAVNLALNVNKVAIPAIALSAIASLPVAEGGPVSYGVCVSACLSLATPVVMPACLVGCIGVSGPWCP